MKLEHIQMTIRGLALAALSSTLVACAGYAQGDFSSSNSDVVNAANAEIDHSNSTGNRDTQCSNYVAAVLRRLGYKVPAFRANDFDQIAETYLKGWQKTEFSTEELSEGRAELRKFLNSAPDHTAFFAQWPRTGESGHVAIVEKVAEDTYKIYQAQAGANTPYSKNVPVESLLYGRMGVQRSRLRLWTE